MSLDFLLPTVVRTDISCPALRKEISLSHAISDEEKRPLRTETDLKTNLFAVLTLTVVASFNVAAQSPVTSHSSLDDVRQVTVAFQTALLKKEALRENVWVNSAG